MEEIEKELNLMNEILSRLAKNPKVSNLYIFTSGIPMNLL